MNDLNKWGAICNDVYIGDYIEGVGKDNGHTYRWINKSSRCILYTKYVNTFYVCFVSSSTRALFMLFSP